jgi:hypothetical protein
MSAAEAAFIVGVIALSGTLTANLLTTRAGRRAAFVQELRARTADAFREAFVVQHAMEWVTWHARNDPDAVNKAMKREYAAEVHRGLPALLGSIAATAALSIDVYHGMQPVLEALYKTEGRVARAMRFVDSHGPLREEAIDRLSELHDEVQELYKVLPVWVAEVMAVAVKPSGNA